MVKYWRFRFAFFIVLILWLTACTPTATEPIPTGRPVTGEPPTSTSEPTVAVSTPERATVTSAQLEGTTWQLLSYGPADSPITPFPNMPITAAFDDRGQLYGSSGCNNYLTPIIINDPYIRISYVEQTRRVCVSEARLAQDAAYKEALESADTISVYDDSLVITYDGGVLHFVARSPLAPTPLDGTNWRLLQIDGDEAVHWPALTNTVVLLAFDSGQVDSFGGCNVYSGPYRMASQSLIAFRDLPQRERLCPEAGVMSQESSFINALRSAISFTREGARLIIPGSEIGSILTFEATLPLTGAPFTTTTWQLAELDLSTGQLPLPETNLTIEFREDGSFDGSGGCNDYGGRFTTTRASLTLSDIISTELGCSEEEIINDEVVIPAEGERIMLQEALFLNYLRTTHHAAVDHDQLYIVHDNGIMRFIRE